MLSHGLPGILTACMIVASAAAQVTVGPGFGGFVDISATGTVLPGAGDDTAHGFVSTVGNDLIPAGNVVVTSNGCVVAGAIPAASIYLNTGITSATTGTALGYSAANKAVCAFWDDLSGSGAPAATLFWQEISGVLYIQWQNIGHFPTTSGGPGITFQIQVVGNAGCSASVIHMIYPDATFGGPQGVYDGGGSATVGYIGGTALTNFEYSFDTFGAIPDGTSLAIVGNAVHQTWSSPLGPGSIQYVVCGGSALGAYQLLVTLNGGLFPKGWLYGIDITFPELLSEVGVPPFLGPLDGAGSAQIGPIIGAPSGLTVYSIAFDIPPGSTPTAHSLPSSYTVP